MADIVVCAACQTKLKVPENSTAKALRCPKCKGIVPVQQAKPAPVPLPKPEDEFGVNEPAPEQDEELEVNEPANEDEELEVNEAADEEAADEDDEEAVEEDEESALVELGFGEGKDPYKLAKIPDEARKAVQKAFVKNEKALWAGRPVKELVESKAWLGFVAAGICAAVTLMVCVITGLIALLADSTGVKIVAPLLGLVFGVLFLGVGVVAVVFRKNIGGNIKACYVVSDQRAYIFDGNAIRAFTPVQMKKMKCVETAKVAGAGDLIFAYDFMGDQGVQVDRETAQEHKDVGGSQSSTPVGFLNIEKVQLVRRMLHETLIDPGLKKDKKKRKAAKKNRR